MLSEYMGGTKTKGPPHVAQPAVDGGVERAVDELDVGLDDRLPERGWQRSLSAALRQGGPAGKRPGADNNRRRSRTSHPRKPAEICITA